MATVREILDKYKLVGGGDDVQRVEVVAPGQAAHVADGGKDIHVWDQYLGQAVPDEVIQQVKDVRAMLPDPNYTMYKMKVDAGLFMQGGTLEGVAIKGCDKSKCIMFTDTAAYKTKLAGEIQKAADAIKVLMAAETDDDRRLALHIEWMKHMAYKHLMNGREGPSSAINTYDGAIFTWGMGYGATGVLRQVLAKIHEIEKRKSANLDDHLVQKLFYLCGFKFHDGRYWVVDVDAKKVYADSKAIPTAEYNAFRYIHDTLELHFMWTLAARDDDTRGTLLDAQKETFFGLTGKVALANRIQTGALYTFLAHLQHWTGDTDMDLVGYGFSADAAPRVAIFYPSEKADAEIAVQAVHRFYKWRSPDFNENSFKQVREYWSQMIALDAKDEGTTEFNPSYPIMTAPSVSGPVPDGHLGGKREDGTYFDLGPCADFLRLPDGTQPEPPPGKSKQRKPSTETFGPPPPPGWGADNAAPPAQAPPENSSAEPFGPPLPPGWTENGAPAEEPGEAQPKTPEKASSWWSEPPSWTFCVASGTLVATVDGARVIDELREGDEVLAFDLGGRAVVPARITRTLAHDGALCLQIHFGGPAPLEVTDEHPLFVRGEWRKAGEIRVGDELLSLGRERALQARVVSRIDRLVEPQTVYDLTVATHHTFFAGTVLVHNKLP